MTKQVLMVRVMIASPSDVAQERRIIRDTIHDWNDIHALDRGIVLLPVSWETHASPEVGDRPQEIINKQILRDCDLLVAVFWSRVGSSTGKAISGTVEEIEEHRRAGKPAMVYFSSVPVEKGSVDPDNYAALLEFKRELRERSLFVEYESLGDFKLKFARQLTLTIIRQFPSDRTNEDRTSTDKKAADPGVFYSKATPRPEPVDLTSDAELLLQFAAEETDGTVTMFSTLDGLYVATTSTTFVAAGGDSREEARWRDAVNCLLENKLIEDRGGRGEVFSITARGYDVADHLGPPVAPEPEAPD
jgi:hypothetical protein